MIIKDDSNLVDKFIEQNKLPENSDGVPAGVVLRTVIQNAGRTLLSMQSGQSGLYAFRSDSTGFAFILKAPKIKKGIRPEPELTAILPYFNGGKSKASGVAALERQLDYYVRDRLKSEREKINSAQKTHEIVEFGEMKFTYWEGSFYDVNVVDMVIIK